MEGEVLELIPVSKVPPLVNELKNGTFTAETIKTLRNLCAKGREIQDIIRETVPQEFILSHLKTESEHLQGVLQLLNNVCVQNEENQVALFDLVTATFKSIEWKVNTATAALHFILTCTAPGCSMRSKISVELLEPFWSLPDDDNLEYLIITLMPTIACQIVDYALAHEPVVFLMLDRLHDAVEEQPECVDAPVFIKHLLGFIAQEQLPIKMAKSKLVGIFCALIGTYEPAWREAHNQNAADVIMTTKKIDVTDPILLEWCVAALRILRGDAEDEL